MYNLVQFVYSVKCHGFLCVFSLDFVTNSLNPTEDWDGREEMLRQFDMNMSYGPCLGLTRLERWERANALGLNPSKDIEGFLRDGKVELECLWDGRV